MVISMTVLYGFDVECVESLNQLLLACRNECEMELLERWPVPLSMDVQHMTDGRIQEREPKKEARSRLEQIENEVKVVVVLIQVLVVASVHDHRGRVLGISMDPCNEVVTALGGAPQVTAFDWNDPLVEYFGVGVVEAMVVICGNNGAERKTNQGV